MPHLTLCQPRGAVALTRPPRKQWDKTQGPEAVEKQPQDRGSIAQHIQAAQGEDVAERVAGRVRILPGGSSRVVTTAVSQDSNPSLSTWPKLTRWSGLQFAVWPQGEVQIHVAKCDSGSRPLSSVPTNEHHHIWDPKQSLCEHQEVILPSPQHSRAPLGAPHFMFVLSLLSSEEIWVMYIRCEH